MCTLATVPSTAQTPVPGRPQDAVEASVGR